MRKVEIYEGDKLVFEGSISNGNKFLGKHKYYLNHIKAGLRSVPHFFPYRVFIHGAEYLPRELILKKRDKDILEIGDWLNVKNIDFLIEDIVEIENDYKLVYLTSKDIKLPYVVRGKINFQNVYNYIRRKLKQNEVK
jgi:hypothetical protein